MKIFTTVRKVSAEVPMSFFNFERFEKQCGDFSLIDARINFKSLLEIKDKKLVYFEIEEPNRFASTDPAFRRDEYEWCFHKILTVCPYTAEWLNKTQGKDRRQFVFFPFNENLIPPKREKLYDVIYFGGIHSQEIFRMIKIISKFNYRFIAPNEIKSYGVIANSKIARKIKKILSLKSPKEKYITDKDIPHLKKLELISQTKVTIVHNLLSFNVAYARNIQNTPDFKSNRAFESIPPKNFLRTILHFFLKKEYLVPQQKTRLLEAAFCRSLILCRKDPFNVIEKFFTPDKEFVYYEEGRLEEKLRDILVHYDDYVEIIENAYQKATKEYTTLAFFEKYLKNLN
jgi:hypothetical protein